MSSTKDYAALVLEQMNSGSKDIFEKYNSLIKAVNAEYTNKISELGKNYNTLKNAASSQAKINLANIQKKLSDQGLHASGESLQAELESNSGLLKSLSNLNSSYQSEKKTLETNRISDTLKLDSQKLSENNSYITSMYKTYLSQLNEDRNYALDEEYLELDKRKNEAQINEINSSIKKTESDIKNSNMKTEEYIRKKINEAMNSYNGKTENKGITPSMDPSKLLDTIVKKYTKEDWGGAVTEDTKSIINSVLSILNNGDISWDYRYELSVYAKAMGYIK